MPGIDNDGHNNDMRRDVSYRELTGKRASFTAPVFPVNSLSYVMSHVIALAVVVYLAAVIDMVRGRHFCGRHCMLE